MIRSLAIPSEANDHVLQSRLHKTGFTDEDISNIMNDIHSDSYRNYIATNTHMLAILKEIVGSSWISFEYLPEVVMPNSGTTAGTSLADFFFISAFNQVVKYFHNLCEQLGFTQTFDAPEAATFFGLDLASSNYTTPPPKNLGRGHSIRDSLVTHSVSCECALAVFQKCVCRLSFGAATALALGSGAHR